LYMNILLSFILVLSQAQESVCISGTLSKASCCETPRYLSFLHAHLLAYYHRLLVTTQATLAKVAHNPGNGIIFGRRRLFGLEICSRTFARVPQQSPLGSYVC